ncbi:hypothetical protein RRG08_046877 [Elysia crispata]|uniref:Uncharacterized protein n=1 Tax=Elysia crispata TaxID=231223 RepID=A0AAE1DGK4_9GAST|nr:hypothetical protein RRG08_046877 [Elysia crispata]
MPFCQTPTTSESIPPCAAQPLLQKLRPLQIPAAHNVLLATPVAHHTPIPVPIYWQEQVKAGLDQDNQLGVLEPVPIGTPVSWCHRMVVCAKKSGKPH